VSGASLANPGASGSLIAALSWVQEVLFGPVATSVGAIAIGSIGLMMLSGRIALRQGTRTVLGLFILFGASGIATGLVSGAYGLAEPPPSPLTEAIVSEVMPVAPAVSTYDPYAGASALPRFSRSSQEEPPN
jgi:type IV secretory pathway VirB2 component (pilin)